MTINDLYTELDALTIATPNMAAVQLSATLRGITFEAAMVEQTCSWCTALDDAIERSAREAAIYIGNAEDIATTGTQRAAWYHEAHDHLTEVNRLAQIRTIAAQLLADTGTDRIGKSATTVVAAQQITAGAVFTDGSGEAWTVTGTEWGESATEYPVITLIARSTAGRTRTFVVYPTDQIRINR
ncbi:MULTISPECIES: hypothetical protein [Nocardiaceae]|uniref:Uncharacterized protein n=1 Tax=Williamsia limnetica TaxID=882452 RepID=A0A318REF8_WILLI|nr:hypothetical protein [Williamsia limnetica]PYE11994.1 hypothetical protein DFR67_1262 [Williamsia limnetica]